MKIEDLVIDSLRVIDKIGYWPKFCDAKIKRLDFDFSEKSLLMEIFYIDVELNLEMSFKLKFINIKEMELDEIMSENVIDEITLEKSNGFIRVEVLSCFGLKGYFNASSVFLVDFSII